MDLLLQSSFAEKERELYATFSELINRFKIKIVYNQPLQEKIFSVDVEHDESGTFVCCGMYNHVLNTVYCFTDLSILNSIDFQPLSLIGHNAKSDIELLQFWGANVKYDNLIHDTMLYGHILDSSLKSYGLKDMAKRELGIEYPSYDDIVGKRTEKQSKPRRTLDQWPIEIVAMYNAMDVFVTNKLYIKQLSGYNCIPYYKEIEQPASLVFSRMETRGTCIDVEYLKSLKNELEAQKEPIVKEIKNELGDINLNSPKQLLEALHAKEIYPKLKGKDTTDKRALVCLKGNAIIDLLLQFSEVDTLLSSFVYPYLERGNEKP